MFEDDDTTDDESLRKRPGERTRRLSTYDDGNGLDPQEHYKKPTA